MPKLKDISAAPRQKKASLTVDAATAELVRRVANYEGRSKDITGIVNDMLVAYLQQTHPDWELDFADDDPDERRSGERRGAGFKGTGKTIPGADKPGINRRKGGERRKKSAAKKKR